MGRGAGTADVDGGIAGAEHLDKAKVAQLWEGGKGENVRRCKDDEERKNYTWCYKAYINRMSKTKQTQTSSGVVRQFSIYVQSNKQDNLYELE